MQLPLAAMAGTFLLRIAEVMCEAAPTILFGLTVAGATNALLGRECIRRLAGVGSSTMLLRASLWGSLLPVCSFGVLPVARVLAGAGVPTSAILAFALAAPMLNPLTMVYGWTALPADLFLMIVATTLAASWLVGWMLAERSEGAGIEAESVGDELGATPGARLANAGLAAARIFTGPFLIDLAIGLLGAGAFAALLPGDTLGHHLHYRDPWAGPLMAIAVAGQFIDPARGVMMIGQMHQVEYSVAASLALHVFGVGVNLAVVGILLRSLGSARTLAVGAALLGVVLAAGSAADFLIDHPATDDDDTHALDDLARPMTASADRFPWETIPSRISQRLDWPNSAALALLCVLAVLGGMARWRGWKSVGVGVLDPSDRVSQGAWSRPIPARWFRRCCVIGIASLVFLCLYIYFPSPDELLTDMTIARADMFSAVRSGRLDVARRHLERLRQLSAKLSPAAALRGESLGPEFESEHLAFVNALDRLREAIDASDAESASARVMEFIRVHGRFHDGIRATVEHRRPRAAPDASAG